MRLRTPRLREAGRRRISPLAGVGLVVAVLAVSTLVSSPLASAGEATPTPAPPATSTPTPAGPPTPTATPTPTPTPIPTFPSLDGTVVFSEFIIPGIATSRLDVQVTAVQSAPFTITLADDVAGLFPKSGEILLGKTELLQYDNNSGSCGMLAVDQLCVTARAKVGQPKTHAVGTQAKLATQLTAPLSGSGVGHTTLATTIALLAVPPFAISVGSDSNFGIPGFLTISHQDTDAGGVATEYFQYDRSCGSGSQLCLIARALNPNSVASAHPKDGYAQPGGTPGRSFVDKHTQIEVKTNAGFVGGSLLVYGVDGGNNIVDPELIGYNNVASKIKTPASTELYVTTRGAPAATFKNTSILDHAAGSIVTGPDTHVVCRVHFVQPMPGGNPPGASNSVGLFPACYTQVEPNPPPKTLDPKVLSVPLVGQTLLVPTAFNQPFLSTGGYTHILFGPVPLVDTNGNTDGILNLISPCIIGFTPLANLLIEVSLNVDQDFATPNTGDIKVVLDMNHDAVPDNGDECDDPGGTGDIVQTTYIYPGDPDTSDDDTDGDGCTDDRELDDNIGTGGVRDPWNPHDFYEVTGDNAVSSSDFFDVAIRFGSTLVGGPPYGPEFDRGLTYGPFAHNLSGPDGAIAIPDIFHVAAQFGAICLLPPTPTPAPTPTATPLP